MYFSRDIVTMKKKAANYTACTRDDDLHISLIGLNLWLRLISSSIHLRCRFPCHEFNLYLDGGIALINLILGFVRPRSGSEHLLLLLNLKKMVCGGQSRPGRVSYFNLLHI